jgi:hypothetical protein
LLFVFAEVENLADRRLGVGGNLDKIEARHLGTGKGIHFADDAHILAGLVDKTDFTRPDCVIDLRAGWLALGGASCGFADVPSPLVASD